MRGSVPEMHGILLHNYDASWQRDATCFRFIYFSEPIHPFENQLNPPLLLYVCTSGISIVIWKLRRTIRPTRTQIMCPKYALPYISHCKQTWDTSCDAPIMMVVSLKFSPVSAGAKATDRTKLRFAQNV